MELVNIDNYHLLNRIEELEKENRHLKEWQFSEGDINRMERLKTENEVLKTELRAANRMLKTVLSRYNDIKKSKETRELESTLQVIEQELYKPIKKENKEDTKVKKVINTFKSWYA